MNYYQSGEAINGLKWNWIGGLIGVGAVFLLFAWLQFRHKDIRVSGEGGWNLPFLRFFKKEPPQS